jgi:heat shock protein HslJ
VRRVALCCLLLGLVAQLDWPGEAPGKGWMGRAQAEEAARRFPFDQRFVVTYLNGQDFGGRSLTLSVRREAGGRGTRGTGFAGCNTWFGRVEVGEGGRIAVGEIGTTRKFCHRDRMKTEGEFLAILRSLDRWRMDGRNLMLRGDKGVLVLSPASRTAALW